MNKKINYKELEKYIHEITPEDRLTHFDIVTCIKVGLIDKWKNKTLLHVGCNSGSNTIVLSNLGINVIALDINEQALEVARKNLEDYSSWLRGKVSFVQSDILDISKKLFEAPIEGLFCSNVLEHLVPEDVTKAVQILYDTLEEGADYYITVPYEHTYDDPHHRIIFTDNNISKITSVFKEGTIYTDTGFFVIIGTKSKIL